MKLLTYLTFLLHNAHFPGGPRILIRLGRTDVTKADAQKRRTILKQSTDRSLVDRTMPSAGLDSDGLRLYFGALGLSEMELVAICGAHDLGRHVTLIDMPKSCLKELTRECLEDAPILMPFINEDPDGFSNRYFKKLLLWYDRSITPGDRPVDIVRIYRAICARRARAPHIF